MEARRDTAEAILATALEVFSAKGYEHATTREIAERAGIAKGLLYYHFQNKEQMLHRICLALADELIGAMGEAIAEERRAGGPVEARIRAILLGYARVFVRTRSFNRILFHDLEYLGPEARAEVVAKQTTNVHQLRDYLTELVAAGELRGLDPTVMTFSLISAVHWLFFWFKPGGALTLEQVIDQIAELYLHGAAAP